MKANSSKIKGSMSALLIVISLGSNTEPSIWKVYKICLLNKERSAYVHTHLHKLYVIILFLQSCVKDPQLASLLLSSELAIILEKTCAHLSSLTNSKLPKKPVPSEIGIGVHYPLKQ